MVILCTTEKNRFGRALVIIYQKLNRILNAHIAMCNRKIIYYEYIYFNSFIVNQNSSLWYEFSLRG